MTERYASLVWGLIFNMKLDRVLLVKQPRPQEYSPHNWEPVLSLQTHATYTQPTLIESQERLTLEVMRHTGHQLRPRCWVPILKFDAPGVSETVWACTTGSWAKLCKNNTTLHMWPVGTYPRTDQTSLRWIIEMAREQVRSGGKHTGTLVKLGGWEPSIPSIETNDYERSVHTGDAMDPPPSSLQVKKEGR